MFSGNDRAVQQDIGVFIRADGEGRIIAHRAAGIFGIIARAVFHIEQRRIQRIPDPDADQLSVFENPARMILNLIIPAGL